MKFTKSESLGAGVCAALRCIALEGGSAVTQYDTLYHVCDKHYRKWMKEQGVAEGSTPIIEGPNLVETAQESTLPVVEQTDLVEVAEQTQIELRGKATEMEEVLDSVRNLEIETQEDVDFVKEILADAKGQWKALEVQRKKATAPLNSSLKEINSWFKPAKTSLEQIEAVAKQKLLQAKRVFEERQQALIEEARESDDPIETREALVAAAEGGMDTTGISYRDNWVFEIVDASLIPNEFMIPDEVSIGKVAKSMKEKTNIPGVRVWNDPIVASRSQQ